MILTTNLFPCTYCHINSRISCTCCSRLLFRRYISSIPLKSRYCTPVCVLTLSWLHIIINSFILTICIHMTIFSNICLDRCTILVIPVGNICYFTIIGRYFMMPCNCLMAGIKVFLSIRDALAIDAVNITSIFRLAIAPQIGNSICNQYQMFCSICYWIILIQHRLTSHQTCINIGSIACLT